MTKHQKVMGQLIPPKDLNDVYHEPTAGNLQTVGPILKDGATAD